MRGKILFKLIVKIIDNIKNIIYLNIVYETRYVECEFPQGSFAPCA